MQQHTTLSIWCERVIEAGWLLALAMIPIYFNLHSARHFEPDKATTLRALILIMAAAALIRLLERWNQQPPASSTKKADSAASPNPAAALWQWLNSVPLLIPALFYALVFILATMASVVPQTSFWGSYPRLQGTYTNLSYVALFLLIVAHLRRRAQLERLLTVVVLTGLVVAGYGLIQHLGLDPLPWRGDVITRVASTMGNSIFVAAYLIMVVPLALYRLITSASAAREATPAANPVVDVLWGVAAALLIFGSLALLLGIIKFGAAVQTSDTRYWWTFPGAVIVAAALWVLLTHRPDSDTGVSALPLWPGSVFVVYLVFFTGTYIFSAGATSANGVPMQMVDENMTSALDWWLWMFFAVLGVCAYHLLAIFLPRPAAAPSRLEWGLRTAGYTLIAAALLVTVLFTQSRGPWIGLGTGLFTFFVLLLWQAARRAAASNQPALARTLRLVLGGWVALTLAVGLFLVAFNVSQAPIFEPFRDMPYIGRMGTLLETDEGTGRVRVLIWRGDEHAGGAAALITANPARSLIGWGPESMFVSYNQFYPPSLATIESRGASPDRSHQALLDELVTKGLLGLVSYFFILISFGMLCWRLIRQSADWHWQVFFIACFSVIVTTFMEGLTGIPIVSTLMMFWVTLGITVTGGALAGHYAIGRLAAQPAPAEAEEPAPAEPASKVRTGKKGRRSASARAASAASASAPKESAGPVRYLLYVVVVMLTLVGVWWFNLSTVYADMRFSEGQSITRQEASLQGQIAAMDRFLATIRSNPREDFYYLNLGRTLMTIAEYMRVQGIPIGQEEPDAQVRDILELENTEEIITFLGRTDPLALMSYAEATLNRARELNNLNKDHYANLGRLHNFWFDWTQDPNELIEASAWYTQANVIAPQDVTLLNEHADIQRSLAAYYTATGDSAAAQQATEQAEELLAYSWELDPQYPDTAVRLGDLSLHQGQLSEASTLFAAAIRRVPERVEPYLEDIFAAFEDDPELLQPLHSAYLFRADLRDSADLYAQAGEIATRMGDLDGAVAAYQQATELEPESPQKRLSYTLVLSDTEHYAEALQEARSGLQLAQSQGDSADTAARLEALVAFLEQKAAGGQ